MDAIREIEIEAEKAKLREIGIAHYTINGLSENESIAQYLDEKFTVCFACVRNPYGRNAKLPNWRVFGLSKKSPQIPMGYYGMPGFTFECYDGTAFTTAQEILRRILSYPATFSRRDDDRFCHKKSEGENIVFYKTNPDSQKYLRNHRVQTLTWKA